MKSTPPVCLLALLLLAGAPLAADHGQITVERSPSGPVLAGTQVLFTAKIENLSEAGDDLVDAKVNTFLSDPNLIFLTGSVTTRYVEADEPAGTIVRGNRAGDEDVLVELDPVPPGWTALVRFRAQVPGLLPSGVDDALAQVFLTYCEANCQSIPFFVVVPIVAQPILHLDKTDLGASVGPGETVIYNLLPTNTGSQVATGLTLSDTVPEGTRFDSARSDPRWSCDPDFAPGSVCTLPFDSLSPDDRPKAFAFALRADPAPVPAGIDVLRNTASVTDDGTNSASPEIAFDTELTPLLAAPDLSVSMTDRGAVLRPGETVLYTLDYAQAGDQDATGVVLEATVPAHTRFAAGASSPGWTCSPVSGEAGATCTLPVGDFAAGASASSVFALTLDSALTSGVERIVHTVSIRDDGDNGGDPTPADNVATEETPVDAEPDLAVSKDDADAVARPGEVLTYSLTARNVGTQTATGVFLRETVPAHSTFVPGDSTAGWTCSPGPAAGAVCTLLLGNLSAGDSREATFAVRLDPRLPAGVDELSNLATIGDDGANGEDPDPTNDQDSETTPVQAAPDLVLDKTASAAVVGPGEALVYTLSYRNDGTQDARGVVIEETLPEHATFDAGRSTSGWSCGLGTTAGQADPLKAERIQEPLGTQAVCTLVVGDLAAGESESATFALRLDDRLPTGIDSLVNSAAVADDGANGPDLQPGDNQDSVTTSVEAAPDLVIEKAVSAEVVRPGQTLTYTLTLRNQGSQGATGVVVEESLPEHTTFLPESSTSGWSCLVPLSALRASPSEAARLRDRLLADRFQLHPRPVRHADGLKAERIQEPLKAERIQEPLGAPAVCTLLVGEIAAGESSSITFALTLDEPLPAGLEQITNLAEVTDDGTNGPDLDPADNEDSETTPVDAAPDLVVQKSASAEVVHPGETVPYTLTVSNQGSQGATGVVLEETVPEHTSFAAGASDPAWTCPGGSPAAATDPLKAERIQEPLKAERIQEPLGARALCTLSLGELAVGESRTFAFAVTLAAEVPAGLEQITNLVEVTDDGTNGPDLDPADNEDSETTRVNAAPDLVVQKSASAELVHPGETVPYTLTVSNQGSQGASGVLLEETVPEHTSFAAGASDPAWTCPAGSPDATTDPLKAERIQEPLKAERIQEPLGARALCTLSLGELAVGESRTFAFALTLAAEVPAGLEQITNLVEVTDDGTNGPDLDPADNEDSETTPVNAAPDLVVQKSASASLLHPGETVAYTLTVSNQGSQGASGVLLEETVPEHTSFAAGGSDPAWTCPGGSPAAAADSLKAERIQEPLAASAVCTLPVGELAVGQSRTFTFAVTLAGEVPAGLEQITNLARVTDDGTNGPDLDPADNEDSATTPVEHPPSDPGDPDDPPGPDPDPGTLDLFLADLLVEDRDGSGGATAGDLLGYSASVLAPPDAAAPGTVVTLEVPEHTTLVAGSIRGDGPVTPEIDGTTVHLVLGDLPAGARLGLAWDVTIHEELPEAVDRIVARATVEAQDLPLHPSDDPDTALLDDPTVTPLGDSEAGPVPIPTAGEYALLLFALLLLAAAWRLLWAPSLSS